MFVTHKQAGFSTSLSGKKTVTELYTDKYKINLVGVMLFRVFHICLTHANFIKSYFASKES